MKKITKKIIRYFVYKYYISNNEISRNMVVYNDWIGFNILIDGYYEKDELGTLKNSFNKKLKEKVFLDIGANIGNHSVFMSDFFKEVRSFEPQKKTFKVLSLNTESFSNISIYNHGIDENKREVNFKIPFNNNGGSSEFNDFDLYYEEIVMLKPLSKKLLSDVGYIKIDVEGNEYSVLKSIFENLEEESPVISIELHQNNVYRNEILDLFKKNMYEEVFCLNLPKSRIQRVLKFLINDKTKLINKNLEEISLSKLDFNFLIFQKINSNNIVKF